MIKKKVTANPRRMANNLLSVRIKAKATTVSQLMMLAMLARPGWRNDGSEGADENSSDGESPNADMTRRKSRAAQTKMVTLSLRQNLMKLLALMICVNRKSLSGFG